MSRLDLVVGPNGAGKSTFVRLVVAPTRPGSRFVNADEIAARRWPDDPMAHAHDAAALAEETRNRLIEAHEPFIAETVFSHPAKLELIERAGKAGYTVALHVILVPESLAVARVAHRVTAGGHDVPEDKIRARYARLWVNVASAVALSDSARFWDNSRLEGPRAVALFIRGMTTGMPSWPTWTPEEITKRWPSQK